MAVDITSRASTAEAIQYGSPYKTKREAEEAALKAMRAEERFQRRRKKFHADCMYWTYSLFTVTGAITIVYYLSKALLLLLGLI